MWVRQEEALGWRKSSRSLLEKLFGGSAEAKKPQKRYVQGSDGRTRDEGRRVGVRRGWRRRRVAGKVRRKILSAVISDDDPTDRKVLGDGEGDRNETWSPEGFPELITRETGMN